MRLRFTVLGPVEAHQDGHAIDLGSPRQRNVLGALLIDVNNEVPTDELAIRIWGDDPPLRAAQTLQSYLSRLRSALPCEIHRGPGGYAVRVDEDAVDLHRFRRLTAGARGTDDASAAALLSEALACWRGPCSRGSTRRGRCACAARRSSSGWPPSSTSSTSGSAAGSTRAS